MEKNTQKKTNSDLNLLQTLKKTNNKKLTLQILALIILTGVLLLLVYPYYSRYLDRQDETKFLSLRQDMKDLQKEFNKVDSGWVYSEGCSAPHYVYNSGTPSCEITIRQQKIADINVSTYINIAEKIIGKVDKNAKNDIDLRKTLNRPGFNTPGKGYCVIDLKPSQSIPFVECSNDARDFYYQRTDQ